MNTNTFNSPKVRNMKRKAKGGSGQSKDLATILDKLLGSILRTFKIVKKNKKSDRLLVEYLNLTK